METFAITLVKNNRVEILRRARSTNLRELVAVSTQVSFFAADPYVTPRLGGGGGVSLGVSRGQGTTRRAVGNRSLPKTAPLVLVGGENLRLLDDIPGIAELRVT